MSFLTRRTAGVFVLGSLLFALQVQAAGDSTTLQLTAQFLERYGIQISGLRFRALGPVPDATVIEHALSIGLPQGTPYQLAIDAGTAPRAGLRRLVNVQNSSEFLPYELCQDAACGQPLADGSGRVDGSVLAGRVPANGQVLIHARLRANGPVAAGDYRDAVTVTLSY